MRDQHYSFIINDDNDEKNSSSVSLKQDYERYSSLSQENPNLYVDHQLGEKIVEILPISKSLRGNTQTDYYLEIEFEIKLSKNIKDYCLIIEPGDAAGGKSYFFF